MRFSAGDSFDRYVIESLLGEGGMGEVYRAEDTRLRRKVALKVLRREGETDSETWGRAVARMLREARAVAQLSHAGIVAIYDVGEHDRTPFIAMELVEGQPLRALIREGAGEGAQMGTRLRILLEIARALSAAHQMGLVHRDVKPENVIVRNDGAVKVLDFGIARRFSQGADPVGPTMDGALATMTAEGALVGTPAYMAPEQLRGEDIDARADQFAWGVVAYELFAGKLPFRSDKGAVSLMASILSDEPPPLENVPEGVWEVISRALSKEPEDRFASMDEVASDLVAFVTGEDMRTPTSGRAASLIATGGMRTPRTGKVVPPGKTSRGWLVGAALLAIVAAGGAALAFRPRPAAAPVEVQAAAAGPVATTLMDLPMPPTESAEARIAYREGMQAVRDATWHTALEAFDRARKADPGLAAAHLRYAMVQSGFDIGVAREALRKAIGLRTSLTERDQAMLEALVPDIQNDPRDHEASARRFAEVSARYPADAELVFWHARQLHDAEGDAGAERVLALTNRCVELDPRYADCWQTKNFVLRPLGRYEEALAALDKCIQVSPSAVDCLGDKILLVARLGQCDVAAETARRWMAIDPSASLPHEYLGRALYGMGEPEAAVRAALDQAERRYRASHMDWYADMLGFRRAIAFGEFGTAVRMADEIAAKGSPPFPKEGDTLTFGRLETRFEMGDLEGAARVAEEFLEKSALRSYTEEVKEGAVDPTVSMHAARLRAGLISRESYQAARSEWLERQAPTLTSMPRGQRMRIWNMAFSFPAYSPELAREALARAPEIVGSPIGELPKVNPVHAFSLGRLYFLAGRYSEATPLLEKAASGCPIEGSELWTIQRWAQVGMVRENNGDKPGACTAYRNVLSRWGNTKESVTAREVEKRAKVLGCVVTEARGGAQPGDRASVGRGT